MHLSDIHFGVENADAVAAARDYALGEGVDALIFTGDITQSGRRREFAAARDWMQQLPEPRVSTPGNHDTPYFDLASRLLWPWARYDAFIRRAALEGCDIGEVQVVTINTARGAQPRINWSKGQIRARDAQWACEAMAGAGTALRVVGCHHPLTEITGGPMTGRVWGGRRACSILAEGKVDLILTGHVHMPFAHPLPCGDGKTYSVGAGTLSLRERGSPAGFNLIEADLGEVRITSMGWTGSHFEPQRTWGFERRGA